MDILNRIWLGIKKFFFGTFYVWFAVIVAIIVGLIWGTGAGFFTGIGIVLAVILYVWGRSIWWFISGTGDFKGRNGLLKRLWNKIFKK